MRMKKWLVPLLVVALLVAVAVPAVALGLGNQAWGNVDPTTPSDEDRAKELAPVASVEVQPSEAAEAQYAAHVEFGLRNGCVEPAGYEVDQEEKTFKAKVYVSVPADPTTICGQVYGNASYDIPLEGDFVSGETYTVDVNGTTTAFMAE
ncbi:MAG: hypothetical protein ACYC1C_16935 [Chloroflexota bacterium]